MTTIILITAIFLFINGTPYIRIRLGRWPWEHGLPLLKTLGVAIVSLAFSSAAYAVTPAPDGGYPGGNTAEGDDALFSLTGDGVNNTAVGWQALYSNTIGNDNTAIGLTALYGNIDGSKNTAIGLPALYINTSGSSNTAIGDSALANNTTELQHCDWQRFAV